jgi:DNA-binding NarL/FixJ family response regulator
MYRLARSRAYRTTGPQVGRSPSGARGAAAAILPGAMTAPAPVTRLTCLIVDDSSPFFEAARQLLADDGVAVVGFAATADQAVNETLALAPDVALVDVNLGAESGFDVAHRLAGLPHGGPPVVLISAESGSELAELVEASRALGFVSKTDLSGDAIRKLLNGAGSGG